MTDKPALRKVSSHIGKGNINGNSSSRPTMMTTDHYGSVESDLYDLWGSSDTTYASTLSNRIDGQTSTEADYSSEDSCSHPPGRRRGWSPWSGISADLKLSMLSNFSTAYNVLNVSLALYILSDTHPEMTARDDSLVSSALFGGMILGQLLGGTLGDVLGRHTAMAVVMFLQVFAAILSSLVTDVELLISLPLHDLEIRMSLFAVLAFWRFILGLGCGGVYPLSATLTAESTSDSNSPVTDSQEKAKHVALAFSFQGIGYLTVPIATWIIVTFLKDTSDTAWRLILGLGALPGIALTVSRIRGLAAQRNRNDISGKCFVKEAQRDIAASLKEEHHSSVIESIKAEPDLALKLLGTAGCWLLFDILFYGNTLFQPVVLSTAFGAEAETIYKAARDTALISMMALPGYFVSVWMVGRQSPRYIQMQGFLVMALLYACIAHYFDAMAGHRYLLLAVYGSTFFFSNYGPNATTFMLPSMTFSHDCRSTLNGICAACGKVGALIGSVVFVTASEAFEQTAVFWCCSILSLVGCAVTVVCVSKTRYEAAEVNGRCDVTDLEQGNCQLQLDQLMVASEATYMLRPVFSVPSMLSVPEIGAR